MSENESLVDRVRPLLPGIAARVLQTERERCVPAETIAELKQAGLFRSLQAKSFGGLEAHPADFFAAVIEVSAVCPSTGWVLAVMGVHPFEQGRMPPELQKEILGADPDALIGSSYSVAGEAKRVPGGFRLSGRWLSSSGVDHASWVVVGANEPPVSPDETPVASRFFVPRADVSLIDDWFVMGLEGTGSKSLVIEDVFVPSHRVVPKNAAPDLRINGGPIFRLPQDIVYLVPGAAPAIGAAKGAYAEYMRQTRDKMARGGEKAALSASTKSRIAKAKATIDAEEMRLLSDLREMYAQVEFGRELTPEQIGRFGHGFSRVADACIEAVRGLFETMGAAAIYSGNPMQRYYRDLIAMRQHATQDSDRGALRQAESELNADGS